MEACDFHRRSSPAWGRNCKFPFISSRVALGTSVKWEDFKFGFHPHFRFPIISLHLKGIAGQLYPGPSLGVLTQESDTFEPRDLRLEQAWARRPSGQAWNGSSAPHRSCWRSRDQWFSLSSICNHRQAWSRRRSFRLGSRDMAFHSAGRMHDLGFLVPVCHPFNRWTRFPVAFSKKIWLSSARKPDIRLSSGVLCARFLVCPIINNTITKTVFSVAFFHCNCCHYQNPKPELVPSFSSPPLRSSVTFLPTVPRGGTVGLQTDFFSFSFQPPTWRRRRRRRRRNTSYSYYFVCFQCLCSLGWALNATTEKTRAGSEEPITPV